MPEPLPALWPTSVPLLASEAMRRWPCADSTGPGSLSSSGPFLDTAGVDGYRSASPGARQSIPFAGGGGATPGKASPKNRPRPDGPKRPCIGGHPARSLPTKPRPECSLRSEPERDEIPNQQPRVGWGCGYWWRAALGHPDVRGRRPAGLTGSLSASSRSRRRSTNARSKNGCQPITQLFTARIL
jgi:hypothetical protein